MPIHDWTRVDAGTFHHFHHSWIEEIQRALNAGLLPAGYYAMAEQRAAGFGPDVLALEAQDNGTHAQPSNGAPSHSGGGPIALAVPKTRPNAAVELAYYRRKQSVVAVRQSEGDRIVAMIEIVSLGNKSSRYALRSFVQKAAALIDRQIHLLVLDLHPPGARDPFGIHAAIWEEIEGAEPAGPPVKPLTLVSYDAGSGVQAYVEPVAVGDVLPEMPLFLQPNGCIYVPLEITYRAAFAALPRRWQVVLEPRPS